MVNQSKSNDQRFWKKWRDSGAVGNMHDAYERLLEPMRANERAVETLVQENSPLTGIEQALQDGCNIHAFLSGGGLRVVRIEQGEVLRGYGEHPSIDHALRHADEDFLTGGKNKVYGTKHLEYMTGSQSTTSPLDAWVRGGSTFDVYRRNEQVVFELHGYAQTETPPEVLGVVDAGEQPVRWTNRGYTFETIRDTFPNGEPCHSTRIVDSPEGRSGSDPWMYRIVKTGTGKNFVEALENAFEAEEVEVEKVAS